MNKNKEFIKNTIILFIGKFSTQIIAFLLLPIYTFKLNTEDYGYIDLLQTYISLFAPVCLLQLDAAIFRFLIDARENDDKKKKIISTSFFCIILIVGIISLISLFLYQYVEIKYFHLIILNIFSLIVNMFMMSISRGNGNNVRYSIASCINAITNLISNFIFIYIYKFGASSILISSFVSNIISAIYIVILEKIYKYISTKNINLLIFKEMLKYSIPMIPNVLSWWIVGLSDRTIIVGFLSVASNAIYSVACKFSNILNSVFSIFSMSWQETASIHINDVDSEKFFSDIINFVFEFFLLLSFCIIGIMPLFFNFAIGEKYIEAYNYIPILILGNVCNVLVGLFGGIYVAKKMTKRVASTTIYSALINIIINVLLIKQIGLYAACISTFCAYFIMSIYRYIDIKKYVKVKIDLMLVCKYMIFIIVLLLMYYYKMKYLSLFITVLMIIYYMIDNRKYIFYLYNKLKNRFSKENDLEFIKDDDKII